MIREPYTQQALRDHLRHEHNMSLFSGSIKEIVYGGNDGIVTTFAVIAGFTGAYSSTSTTLNLSILTVLLFGLANLFADGSAMGLGSFLSLRAEKNVYRAFKEKERYEIKHNPDMEKAETQQILQSRGYSIADAKALTELLAKNSDYWLSFMMTDELELANPEKESAVRNGLMTFLSFSFFGFIPLIPYLLLKDPTSSFTWSCVFTFFALVTLGVVSGHASGRNRRITILETVAVGTTAASVAFIVGLFFR
jgi:VIT1/CCC1 family predicted Fe2+/Mn2+ transporter|tara:strand:- start:533 stop:1285 length:753 start_codon:yes stop_codon:yes gene_type:complete